MTLVPEHELNLIRQAKQGHAESFGLLYDHYLAPIYRFVALKTDSKEEAEDIVHEVFLSAWKHVNGFNEQGHPFSSWLYQIARNKIIDHYRTKKTHVTIELVDEEHVKVTDGVEQKVDLGFNLEQVKKVLNQLSDDQQDVILMRFVEDLSYQEIAAALDKNEGAIRLIQHRAIHNLRRILKHHEQFS